MSEPGQKRILLAVLGSLGDLHPTLALGLEMQRRGHRVTIASTPFYREKVQGLGLGFTPLRPDWDPTDRELIAQCEDLRTGPEVLVRKLVLPYLPVMYEDLLAAAAQADLMIATELVFAAPLVSEKLGLPWVSEILSPTSFFSAYDPSLLVNIPELYRLRNAGWIINRAILQLGKLISWSWWQPVRRLRREQGLRVACDPIFKDKFSPYLVLALFSRSLAQPQPDWPKQTLEPGFVFFDRANAGSGDSPELAAFLDAGDPPIVFTLGSTAVYNPGNFYEASMAAVRRLGRRAVMLGAKPEVGMGSRDVLILPYAPHSQVFPRAAAIAHQGGSGTTGQALRAGRPQLIVPYGWDQPDNGARIERMGAGLCLERSRYSAETATHALRRLLNEPAFAAKAAEAEAQIAAENAAVSACDAMEKVLSGRGAGL
jgi:UDP:flavonoid glycosyltransferase YjiC (YdhE family)